MVDASVKHISEYVVLPYLNGMCNGLQRLKKTINVVFCFATACPASLGGMSGVILFGLAPNNFFLFFLSNFAPNLLKVYINSSFRFCFFIFSYLIYVLSINIFLFELFYKIEIVF
jgi:hypothetical protein